MRFLLISLVALPLAVFGKTDPCLKTAKEKSVGYERQWIKKNEGATVEDLLSVAVAKGEDGAESTWSEMTPRGAKYGIFVESEKTEDNTHWEVVLNPKTCKEVGRAVRKNAP